MEIEKLTKEQVIEKFGKVKMKFSYYYKYSFDFKGEKDGFVFRGSYGGSSDDIYKLEITPDTSYNVENFEDELNFFTIKDKNGDVVFKYYDGGW